ncbi:hypothetical protein HPB51_013266 [Rhipicephalus microplus]|uniref:Uncharacterized protein n=1 Tax=Rhipicephalus microplus TaxID=6941 RepID=A0A9J6EAQ4_RHIMP|nr:hypothetical protein HPB51_013266 [Rhipicephalus microplus]
MLDIIIIQFSFRASSRVWPAWRTRAFRSSSRRLAVAFAESSQFSPRNHVFVFRVHDVFRFRHGHSVLSLPAARPVDEARDQNSRIPGRTAAHLALGGADPGSPVVAAGAVVDACAVAALAPDSVCLLFGSRLEPKPCPGSGRFRGVCPLVPVHGVHRSGRRRRPAQSAPSAVENGAGGHGGAYNDASSHNRESDADRWIPAAPLAHPGPLADMSSGRLTSITRTPSVCRPKRGVRPRGLPGGPPFLAWWTAWRSPTALRRSGDSRWRCLLQPLRTFREQRHSE